MTRSFRQLTVLGAVFGLIACGSSEPTRPRAAVMVTVTTNLAVPAQLDEVQVNVFKSGEPMPLENGVTEVGPGKVMLPAGYEIVPQAEQTLDLVVVVVGFLDDREVSRTLPRNVHITPSWPRDLDLKLKNARAAPAPGPKDVGGAEPVDPPVVPAIARLDIKVDALCTAQARSQCEADGSCAAGTCESGDSALADLPLLLTSDIPDAVDEATVHTECFNVTDCFASALNLTPRDNDCSFEAPPGNGELNLAFELTGTGVGFCDGERCLLPLDRGTSTEGDWSEGDDGSIVVQGAACAQLQAGQVGSVRGVRGQCPSKQRSDWLCPVEKSPDGNAAGAGNAGGAGNAAGAFNTGGIGNSLGAADSGGEAGAAGSAWIVEPTITSQAPFLEPVAPGVIVRTIMNVREPQAQPNYDLRGSPAGLGAFSNDDGSYSLLVSHDIQAMTGSQRAHGADGAFVSQWNLKKLLVTSGDDLGQQTRLWLGAGGGAGYGKPERGVELSSLGLASLSSGPALLLVGEGTANGRAFAFDQAHDIWQLPLLGRAAWGSIVANPTISTTAVVAAIDSSPSGQLYFYYGTKTKSEGPLEQAGLVIGELYGLVVSGQTAEGDHGLVSNAFQLVRLGQVDSMSATDLETLSNKQGLIAFDVPAGGAWDPANTNDFYFVTRTKSRLWRLRFDDATNPKLRGTIDTLLVGSEGQLSPWALTLDGRGHIYLAERPTAGGELSRILRYDLATGTLTTVARASKLFSAGTPGFISDDDSISAIIDASNVLAPGWFLIAFQVNQGNSDDAPGDGQILALYDPGSL